MDQIREMPRSVMDSRHLIVCLAGCFVPKYGRQKDMGGGVLHATPSGSANCRLIPLRRRPCPA
jgi:hypothetical protein